MKAADRTGSVVIDKDIETFHIVRADLRCSSSQSHPRRCLGVVTNSRSGESLRRGVLPKFAVRIPPWSRGADTPAGPRPGSVPTSPAGSPISGDRSVFGKSSTPLVPSSSPTDNTGRVHPRRGRHRRTLDLHEPSVGQTPGSTREGRCGQRAITGCSDCGLVEREGWFLAESNVLTVPQW
jgi:hypothetical protein